MSGRNRLFTALIRTRIGEDTPVEADGPYLLAASSATYNNELASLVRLRKAEEHKSLLVREAEAAKERSATAEVN